MRWSSKDYDDMAKLVIDIYTDYKIKEFPVNAHKTCQMLGINIVPYSAFSEEQTEILLKKSNEAFYVPMAKGKLPIIYYNDKVSNKGRKRYSIFHELKHFVNDDKTESEYEEDMADYFSKYFMCPIPYLVYNNITDTNEIISKFDVSYEVSCYVRQNVINRMRCWGNQVFDYEKPLIDLLCS